MVETSEHSTGSKRRWWLLLAAASLIVLLALGVVALRVTSPLSGVAPPQIADVSSERLLGLGSVVGFAAQYETHAWLGIPFAQPPVEGLRWRAPRAPEAWADTLDALAFGPPCVQLASPHGGVGSDESDGLAGSEDCLYLNIWSPRSESDRVVSENERLPVMVWIHGGGNLIGNAGSPMYDGARLAGSQNVVVVSINYRLGPFGWFSLPALRAEASNLLEASGNFGTLDQIRALEWIQTNIEEFGGDPENVTIFGASAGGTDVLALLVIDAARGLFHRAISQSGSTDSVSRAQAENPLAAEVPGMRHGSAEVTVSLIERAGVVPDREAARGYVEALPEADLLAFLRGRSPREIIDAYRDPQRPDSLEVPLLIRDGSLLPIEAWSSLVRAGRFHHVPVVLGSNRDEMKLFLSQDETYVQRRFGILYRIRDVEDYERRSRYHSELWSVRAVADPASAIVDSGFRGVYGYRFDWDDWPEVLGVDFSKLLGAAHGFEIPFVFGNFDLGDSPLANFLFDEATGPAREGLSAQMMSYWAEFARQGRPGRGGIEDQPMWPGWTTAEDPDTATANVLVFDASADAETRVAEVAVSRDHVIAAVDAEASLRQDEKCELFFELFSRRPEWSVDEYRAIGRRGCAEFPPDAALR